ncbi:Dihydrofolate synthase [Actinokineospora spheciospongiae]|uniref:Dihydrofolate synthase n=1 Tax=Actinokineospora spheciospongiae TaxID=909613 RepID=W7IXP4_9PSEU|nr:Mur ligase family protein [Actinokineospora spheciospongiae]EWC61617.1 Dihydrofolate synthase [Actinokineospora spheciospongiae]
MRERRDFRSLDEAAAELYRFVPGSAALRVGYSLDRLRSFLDGIGAPQDRLRVVHVAGTSGKTSTAYFARAMLQEAGLRTGLTVSPHITSVTERVQVDGEPLPEPVFLELLGRFLPKVTGPLTYFEVLVAFAYWAFAELGVDVAVVETGLGGLLDGTNTATRADKVCAIGDIGLDHTEVLGETLPEIAAQKAGIIHPGNTALLLAQDPVAMAVVREHADRVGAALTVVHDEGPADLPLFQRRNWSLARAATSAVLGRAVTPSALVSAQPPGRLEQYGDLVLDGAHNPQKLDALRESLAERGVTSAAVLANLLVSPPAKLDAALLALLPLAAHLVVPEFTVLGDLPKRSVPAVELAERATALGFASVEVCPGLAEALAALRGRPEPTHLVTGSLYLVSQVRALLSDPGHR